MAVIFITSRPRIGRARCGACLSPAARVKVLDGVILGNFDVVEGGIYYIDWESGEGGVFSADRPAGEDPTAIFRLCLASVTTVARNLGTVGLGLSASRDGRTWFSRVLIRRSTS